MERGQEHLLILYGTRLRIFVSCRICYCVGVSTPPPPFLLVPGLCLSCDVLRSIEVKSWIEIPELWWILKRAEEWGEGIEILCFRWRVQLCNFLCICHIGRDISNYNASCVLCMTLQSRASDRQRKRSQYMIQKFVLTLVGMFPFCGVFLPRGLEPEYDSGPISISKYASSSADCRSG